MYGSFFQCLKTSAFCGEYHRGKGTNTRRKEVLFLSRKTVNTNEMFKAIAKFFSSAKKYLMYRIIQSVRPLMSSVNHRSNIQSHKTSERFCIAFKWAQGLGPSES